MIFQQEICKFVKESMGTMPYKAKQIIILNVIGDKDARAAKIAVRVLDNVTSCSPETRHTKEGAPESRQQSKMSLRGRCSLSYRLTTL